MKKLTILFMLLLCMTASYAQRKTDKLDRGLVATVTQNGNGNFVSWRIFAEEYYDTKYNLYRDGTKLNQTPLSVSNYTDAGGNSSSRYQVAPVIKGVEGEKSAAVTRWTGDFLYSLTNKHEGYMDVPLKPVLNRNGEDVTSHYTINDVSLADVDGDGTVEFIVKRLSDLNYDLSNKTTFNYIECYNLKGQLLWKIDCGPNLLSGSNVELNAVAFDWDLDGRAEVLMRGADNMIIYTAKGDTIRIGSTTADTRWNGMEYTNSGKEYLLYLNGLTGEVYVNMPYPLPRYEVGETTDLDGSSAEATIWGAGILGHRPTKHYFGAPYLDGRKPSIFLGRGCYTRHKMVAFDVDPATHQLVQRWRWNEYSSSSPWFGNGYHNFAIADVDWDGRDEIVFGSMVIDDNGKGLSTTGLGHGDAQHCGDLDPYRHGQEQFACNETRPAMNYRDATTSKIYYRLQSNNDDGRALCGNFTNQYPGCVGLSSQSGVISTVADKVLPDVGGFDLNFRIYWDGDLCEEIVNSPGTEKQAKIDKLGVGRIFLSTGDNMCNYTKNTPSAQGDIFGDWREELVMRKGDNMGLRIYTTNYPTTYRIYSLWHDHQYRNAMVWQMCGYNQPPHLSYFLGEMEGITVAPPPFTTVGRTEVANNGTIDATLNDKHVLVCETNDTKISVAQGVAPYITTFNVPSWVQGTNSNKTDGTAVINRTYYTCDVTGGAFTGSMRLIKQGDGILNLPKVDQTYTGETNIWAGTVNFDGTLKNSSVWLNRFAELNSNGGVFRRIKMDYDAKLRPGRADNRGTITTDTLQLGFGSRIVMDIYDDMTADQLVIGKLFTIEKKNWQYGPKYLTPIIEFVSHKAEGTTTKEGRYLIGQVDGTVSGSLTDIRIEGLENSLKTQLDLAENGKLYLVIAGTRSAGTVTWNGDKSNVWDKANTENFTGDNGESDIFVTGDKVIFDDNAKQFSVTLNGDLEADTILVDNTTAYTFGGNGAIIGNTTLVKRGKGTLSITTDNSYKGGTRISGGAVIVKSLANANQAIGNLGSVASAANKFLLENGGELRTTAAITQGSPMRVETEEGGVVNNAADYIVDRSIYGTKLTKKGTGWMKLNVSNTSLTKMIIAAGTVQCINSGTPANNIEYQGGELRENTSTSYAVSVPKGKQGTWFLANRSTYTNKITGEGTLTMYCTTEKGSNYYATRTAIRCNFSEFAGTLKPTSSLDDPAVLRFTLDIAGSMPKGTMNIPTGVEVQNSGKTFTIGKVTGTGNLGGSCTFSNGVSVGPNTWKAGDDTNWSWSGGVVSNANFVKTGSGKATLRGVSTTSGTFTVSDGEVNIVSATQLGTGKLTIDANGLLSGTNSSSNMLKNSSSVINGTLRPGLTATSTSGTIFFEKNVEIISGAVLELTAKQCATEKAMGGTAIQVNGKLTMNGKLRLHVDASNTLKAGDSIRVWTAGSFEGTPQVEMLDGITWDTSRLSEGLLFVKDIDTAVNPIYLNADPDDIFDVQGRLVRKQATTTKGLPTGIYIRNGKKIVVK